MNQILLALIQQVLLLCIRKLEYLKHSHMFCKKKKKRLNLMCFLSTDGKYFFICYKDGKNKISDNKYIRKQNSLSNFLPCLFFFPRQSGLKT